MRGTVRLHRGVFVVFLLALLAACGGGVAQIDPELLKVRNVFELAMTVGGSIRATDDAVWIRLDGGPFLTRLDPRTGEAVQEITSKRLASGGDVIELDGAVWATASDDDAVVRIDAPG